MDDLIARAQWLFSRMHRQREREAKNEATERGA
jgi:hypothetical protein